MVRAILFVIASQTIKFMAQKTYSTGYHSLPTALVVIEVNNDNKTDIIVANQESNSVGVLYNYYNKMFYAQQAYGLTGTQPQSLSVVDFNGDDRLDIVVACSGESFISIFLNDGPWDFGNRGITYAMKYKSHSSGVAVVDVNDDNKPDIIVTNPGINNIDIIFNRDINSSPLKDAIQLESGTGPTSPLVIDINEDNTPDIIFANYIGNSVGILFNFGNGTFHSLTTYPTGFGSKPKYLFVADVNEDNKLDIIVANSLANNIGIFFNSGNGTFLPQQTYSTGNNSNPSCVSVIDLNNDKKPEIIVVNTNHNTIGIFTNCGNGTFILEDLYSTGLDSNPQFASVADVNGDGKLDIIVANSHTKSKNGNVGVMLGI